MNWNVRQFIDGYVENPTRFSLKDSSTGYAVEVYDLEFIPGEYTQGTYTHRGYFQPIENHLGALSSDNLHSGASALNNRLTSTFNQLNTRLDSASSALDNNITIVGRDAEAKYTNMNNRITGSSDKLLTGISTAEGKLSSSSTTLAGKEATAQTLAPIDSAVFVGAKAEETPSQWDISNSLATTAYVKTYISSNISSFRIPPKSAYNVNIISGTSNSEEFTFRVTWNDSDDTTFDGMTLSKWSYSNLHFRFGSSSAITTSNSTLLTSNTVRNRYSSTGFFVRMAHNPNGSSAFGVKVFTYNTNGIYT